MGKKKLHEYSAVQLPAESLWRLTLLRLESCPSDPRLDPLGLFWAAVPGAKLTTATQTSRVQQPARGALCD